MNFSEFVDSLKSPLYEDEAGLPHCPPGYKFDKNLMMCVPKAEKDKVGTPQKEGSKDLQPGNGAGYKVWGSTGYDGSGYAFEEKPTSNDLAMRGEELDKRYTEYDKQDKEFAKQDARMKYGKAMKPPSLKPGQVKKYNKSKGVWE